MLIKLIRFDYDSNMLLSDLVTEIFRYTLSVVYLKTLKYDFEAKPL